MSNKSESSKTQLEALEAHLLELSAKLKPFSKPSFNIQVELIGKLLELLDEGTDEGREQAKKLLVDWKALLITVDPNPKTFTMTEAAEKMKALTEAGGESLTEESFAIQSLARGLSDSQARLMWHFIQPLFRKDFLSQLPEEIAYRIIGYLTPCDLMACAGVSRTWRRLCEDDRTWRQRCLKKGYVKFDAPSFRFLGGWAANRADGRPEITIFSHMNLQEADENRQEREMAYGQYYKRAPWKSLYLRKTRIISNWQSRAIQSSTVIENPSIIFAITDQIHSGRIVTVSHDNTLRVWNVDDAQPAVTLTGHTNLVQTHQVSDDGKYIVSSSWDDTVRVWCGQTGAQLHVLGGHTNAVLSMSLHGTTLVSGSHDHTLRVWDIVDGKCLHILAEGWGNGMQFDGERVVSASGDSTVKVWNVHTGECLHTLSGHTDPVYSLLFEPERDLVVSGSYDQTFRVWDVRRGTCIAHLVDDGTIMERDPVMQLRGNILVTSSDSDIVVWDIRDGGSCTRRLQSANRHMGDITSMQWLGSGLLVTGSVDGSVKLWDVDKGIFVRDLLRLRSNHWIQALKATETLLVCASQGEGQRTTDFILIDFDASYP